MLDTASDSRAGHGRAGGRPRSRRLPRRRSPTCRRRSHPAPEVPAQIPPRHRPDPVARPRRIRLRQTGPCQPFGAPLRPRTGRRPGPDPGTGRKGRIIKEDVQALVKGGWPSPAPRRWRVGLGCPAGRRKSISPSSARSRPSRCRDQEAVRRQPAPQLGHRAARHPVR